MDVQPTNLQQLLDAIIWTIWTKISEGKGVQPGTSKAYLIKWP